MIGESPPELDTNHDNGNNLGAQATSSYINNCDAKITEENYPNVRQHFDNINKRINEQPTDKKQ